jgi:choline-sulfatase
MMRRRDLLAAPAALLPRRTLAATGERPNIVFFLTDDQARWTIGSYGNKDSHTPNMDRIGREGAVFDRCFVTSPVCSPSRASLMTSQYSFRTGIHDFLDPSRQPELGLSPRFPTWPRQLQQAGYSTGLAGKWHLGLKPEFHPHHLGYDWFYGFLGGGNTTRNPLFEVDGREQELKGFTVDLVGEAAVEFIRRNRSHPLALSVHFREPHGPTTPAPDQDEALFRGRKIEVPRYKGVDPAAVERERLDYYKSIASADRNIGRVLDELDALGLAGNTVVIFAGDNGYMIGQHGLRTKGNAVWMTGARGRRPNMFDDSMLVPCTMRWPGVIRPGTRIGRMISFLDFYPTLVSIAGAASQPADYVPCGLDLSGLLRGSPIPWRSTVFGDYHMCNYYDDNMRMIRTADWKLVTHTSFEFPIELYNLREDPGEETNLSKDARHTSTSLGLLERLRGWQRWIGDPSLPGAEAG